jgi:hypothetical protein
VGYWNGGLPGTTSNAQPDFTDNGNPEAIFRNYVAMIEGPPPGFDGLLAGADIQVGDTDGNGFVTQVLDGFAGWLMSDGWFSYRGYPRRPAGAPGGPRHRHLAPGPEGHAAFRAEPSCLY